MSGRREALLIATSNYQDPHFRRLIAPLNDVKALGAVFADPDLGGFQVSTVLNKNSHLIMERIEKFCVDRSPDDTVLLYFSCHGYTSDTGDLFLVARNTDKDLVLSTAVPDGFLRSVLRRCRASTRILMLDCCFGGAFNAGLLGKGDADTVNIKATFAGAGSGLVVLTASNARERAFEEAGDGGTRKSVFTRTVVDGIRSGDADLDRDGVISAANLHDFVSSRILTSQSLQTPTISTIDGEGVIVISKAKPRPASINLETAPGTGADNRRPDLRPWVRVQDTGTEAANAAVAAVTAMETNLAWQGSQVSLSARYIYQKAKKLMRLRPEDQSGGISWDVLQDVLTRFGTVPDSVWPYRAGEWQLPRGKTQAVLDTEAARYRARLTPVRSVHDLIDQLICGRPVLSSFTVFESTWMTGAVARTGMIKAPKPGDQQLGTVAVTIVDVNEETELLRFAHTWGLSWGDRGFGTMSLETAQTLFAIDQMWSVELDAADHGTFSWDRGAAQRVRLIGPPDSLGEPGGGPARRSGRTPAIRPTARSRTGSIPRPRRTPTASRSAADELIRTVYDGRLLGASWPKLDRTAVLREERGNASTDKVANQVFKALGAFHACMKEAFDRNSWDDRGAPYRAIVHYGRDFDNAFWESGSGAVVLGGGDGQLFNGFYELDVVAKTLADGVVSTMTTLHFGAGQSGALCRGLSLVVGSMVKQHEARQTATEADWLLGDGLLGKSVRGRALCDLLHPGTAYDDPGLGKDPTVGHMDQFVRSSSGQDVTPINSGIPARAFALAAISVGGPSWRKVGLAWYRAMQSPMLRPRATFASFARLTATAADDDVADAIRNAWLEVGVKMAANRRE